MVTPLAGLGVIWQLVAGVIWALLGVLSVLVVSGRRAAVAVILAATAAGLATAITPDALSIGEISGLASILHCIAGLCLPLHLHNGGCWHHVRIEIGHYPERAADDERHDQEAEGEREHLVGFIRPSTDVQEEY